MGSKRSVSQLLLVLVLVTAFLCSSCTTISSTPTSDSLSISTSASSSPTSYSSSSSTLESSSPSSDSSSISTSESSSPTSDSSSGLTLESSSPTSDSSSSSTSESSTPTSDSSSSSTSESSTPTSDSSSSSTSESSSPTSDSSSSSTSESSSPTSVSLSSSTSKSSTSTSDSPITSNTSPTDPPPTTTIPNPLTEEKLLEETQKTLESIKSSYNTLLELTQSIIPTDAPTTSQTEPTSTSNSLANVARDVHFVIRATGDENCSSVICTEITKTMSAIKETTKDLATWTLDNHHLTELDEESITLQNQVDEAKAHKDDEDFKSDAGFIHSQVNDEITEIDKDIDDVKEKIEEIKNGDDINSIILVSVIGGVGGLIIIALVGTSVYALIAKGKKKNKVGLDGPAANIPLKELDKPQEPRNAPEKEALSESQPPNPYTMNPLREPATDVMRSPSARDPYAAQPTRTPQSDIGNSASTRGTYPDQPQRYPPRNFERSTSSRDPNVPSEPRGLNRNQDPFVNQSPKKQPPVVPRKPQGSGRPNPYNGQQHSPRSRLESSDSNGYGIPRATPDPRIPRGRPGPQDERPRGAGPYRDPYSQAPQRGGSRPANPSNYY